MREHLVWSLAAVMSLAAASAWGAAGGPDPSFGTNGIVIAPVLEYSYAESVVRLPDGRLLVGGEAGERAGLHHRDMMLAQFNADGTPDTNFGTDGVVVTVVGTRRGIVKQVMRLPDGKILAAGTLDEQFTGADVVLARYESDGTPDATFGTDGIVVVDIGGIERATSAALLADGKILVAGDTRQTGLPGGCDGMVLRFDDTGDLDDTFGTGGVVLLDHAGRFEQINDMLIEPSGRIILAGWGYDGPIPFTGAAVGIVAALSDGGTPDATFGTGGVTEVAVDVSSHVAQIVRLSDGDFFMQGGGSPGDGTGYSLLARMNSDGTFDTGFGGGDGIISPSSYLMFALTAMPDDRPLGAGPGFLWGHWGAIGAVRMLADGSPDASFGNDGRASLYPVTGDYFNGGAITMVADPDGSAVTIAGFFSPIPIQDDQSRQLAVARFLLEGTACTADAECGACERCGTGGACERGPRSGCVRPGFRGAKLSYAGYPVKSKIQWKWRSGVDASFFDPATDDLSLCMWWGDNLPIYESTIPAGSAWITTAAGSKFKDRAGSHFGIQQVMIGKRKIFLKAKGDAIRANPNGFPDALLQPGDDSIDLEVQMHASNGACLAATYPQAVFTTTYPQHVRSGVGN